MTICKYKMTQDKIAGHDNFLTSNNSMYLIIIGKYVRQNR